jgi:hypothetical protein
MKRLVIPAVAALIMLAACASIMGKWGESRLEKLAEKCIAENKALEPSKARWQNLSTQARTKKKRELEEYKKKRIDLYQAIDTFEKVYAASVGSDGKCRAKECATLEKLRVEIIEGCPGTGESFPRTAPE